MKKLFFALFGILALLQSCTPSVMPNQYVVVTANCWNTMSVIKAGSVPPRLMTPCDRKIILPAYNMDGEVVVSARFMGDVKGEIKIDYQYEIKDPIMFVGAAKFITSSQTDAEGNVDMNTLEKAENSVIDKIAKDIVREYIPTINPIDIDEGRIESDLTPKINKVLQERGILMSGISIDVDFKQQTEQALDAISAYNLYKNANLQDVGKEVIKAQAGKTEVTITQPPKQETEAK